MKLAGTTLGQARIGCTTLRRACLVIMAAAAAIFSCAAPAQTTTETAFARTLFTPWEGFRATVGEPTNDSRRAFLGTKQGASGDVLHWSADAMGVSSLFANDRSSSDTRMADLSLNGQPALIAITHSCTNDTTSPAMLFAFNGTNYTERVGFGESFNPPLRGHGETIVAANFTNNGYLDLFLPYYTRTEDPVMNKLDQCQPTSDSFTPSSRFLLNQGSLQFSDRTSSTAYGGVAESSLSLTAPLYSSWFTGSTPEAAQAVDFDNDGWIDLYTAGRLFMNRSPLIVTSARPQFEALAYGLPTPRGIFDEGAKFLDWLNQGKLDLVVLAQNLDSSNPPTDSHFQLKLYEFNGGTFVRRTTATDGGPLFRTKQGDAVPLYACDTDGLNVADLNNDGLEDVIVGASVRPSNPGPYDTCQGPADTHPIQIFLNRGGYFELDTTPDTDALINGTGGMAVGDIDDDGRLDIIYPEVAGFRKTQMQLLRNVSILNRNGANISRNRITVEVLDANGRQNQYGRRISVIPPGPVGGNASPILSRVVGSLGYLAQNQYVELIGTPYGGPHAVSVTFPVIDTHGTVGVGTRVVSATARAGDRLRFYSPPANGGLGNVTKRFGSTSRFRDSDDDGKSDVFWRNTSGQINVWKMDNVSFDAGHSGPIGYQSNTAALLSTTGDFDGDGKADIVWHDAASGEVRIWTVDGSNKTGEIQVGFIDTAMGWVLAGTGDFNGDGKLDLLWFSPSTGSVKIWPMNGTSRLTVSGLPVEVVLAPTVIPNSGWAIAGVGDVDNDGISDIIWWNQRDGRINHWLIAASMSVKPESGNIGTHLSPGTWKVAGVGDFNADGRSDILWKDDLTGDVELWLTAGLYSYRSIPLAQGVVQAWRVANIGDYDGDGRADIFWRHDAGNVVVWRTRQYATADGTNEGFTYDSGIVQSVLSSWDVQPKKLQANGESVVVQP
jgi:hypothetical protein